jgi:hypothetical protein
MVVRYVFPDGRKMMRPPYTDEEVRDMFRRMQNGPRMMTSVVRGRAGATDPACVVTNPNKPATSRSAADAEAPRSPQDPWQE